MVLPISTPPNALAYATNLIRQNDMARIGIITGIISMVLGYALLYLSSLIKWLLFGRVYTN
jgi:sodium-dependent dicarboxylate transporter 2/3/5